jgi:hypothetical protein
MTRLRCVNGSASAEYTESCIKILSHPRYNHCILICIFVLAMLMTMDEIQAAGTGIREEDVAASAPMVRALLVQRLEQIWSQCEPHVTGATKPDPRFIEAGIRVLDRLAKLYRLDIQAAASGLPESDPVGAAIEAARGQIADLEAKAAESGA